MVQWTHHLLPPLISFSYYLNISIKTSNNNKFAKINDNISARNNVFVERMYYLTITIPLIAIVHLVITQRTQCVRRETHGRNEKSHAYAVRSDAIPSRIQLCATLPIVALCSPSTLFVAVRFCFVRQPLFSPLLNFVAMASKQKTLKGIFLEFFCLLCFAAMVNTGLM